MRRLDRHERRAESSGQHDAPTPHHVSAWQKGAEGERQLGRALDERLSPASIVLHDRRVPGTRGNIDHIVVSSNGVWVIDAKNYTGRIEVRTSNTRGHSGLQIYIDKRRRTKTVEGMEWQCEAVKRLTDPMGLAVPVFAALCFTDSTWPIWSRPKQVGDVWVTCPKMILPLVNAPGPGDDATIQAVANQLSAGLPASTTR